MISPFNPFLCRAGLTKHPLDLRGSRRSLEAARIFLDLEDAKEDQRKVSFLQVRKICRVVWKENNNNIKKEGQCTYYIRKSLLKL